MVLNTRVSIKADYQQPTAAYNYYMYVFHLPLSAKPVSFSFGSSEGWKLHFKLLDYNFFFGGGMPPQPIEETDLILTAAYYTIGSHLIWKKLLKSQRYM